MPERYHKSATRVDHESFNFNINTGHEVIFASKNMRKDITQEDEHKVLSYVGSGTNVVFVRKKRMFSHRQVLNFHSITS